MIVDLTDRYYRWTVGPNVLSRSRFPVRAIVVHHTAGFYGSFDGSEQGELGQIHNLAQDHLTRFGVGPGYHYAAFSTGGAYAVGKWGTYRAHTKGRNPATMNPWNYDAIGIVAFGDYERVRPSGQLVTALKDIIDEINRFAKADLPVYYHGDTLTVNGRGESFSQGTACPGRWLKDALSLPPSVRGGMSDEDLALFEGRGYKVEEHQGPKGYWWLMERS